MFSSFYIIGYLSFYISDEFTVNIKTNCSQAHIFCQSKYNLSEEKLLSFIFRDCSSILFFVFNMQHDKPCESVALTQEVLMRMGCWAYSRISVANHAPFSLPYPSSNTHTHTCSLNRLWSRRDQGRGVERRGGILSSYLLASVSFCPN